MFRLTFFRAKQNPKITLKTTFIGSKLIKLNRTAQFTQHGRHGVAAQPLVVKES